MQTTLFPSATLAEFYRFAVLLTGNIHAAEQVMGAALAEVENQVAQLRNETSRRAWLTSRIRERCLQRREASDPAPRLLREPSDADEKFELLSIEAYLMAQRFHLLPEPERSALALFYLDSFELEEIAKLLKLEEDDLSETLGRARELLQAELRNLHTAPA
ncbi:MAG TPA: sigma-70 family RNA polymerase sigma factor [Chthoniobacteraceae bacterium]|nr:sigma-70 family RNA polymerase sigma factor [Chthoniobacteraceae bacterium]